MWNENEPRDQRGRWTSGGGSSKIASKSRKSRALERMVVAHLKAEESPTDQNVEAAEAAEKAFQAVGGTDAESTRAIDRARGRRAKGKAAAAQKNISLAVAAADKSGVKVKVVDADEARALWGDQWDTIQAAYNAQDDLILINRQHPDWANPSNAIEEHRIGWFSTGDSDRVIQHELAHREHAQRIGWRRISELGARKPKYAEEITREIGRYAATSEAEFVAEMRVGMKAGYRYTDMLMDYYTRLGGVR